MEEIMAFFGSLPTWFRATLLVGGMVIFWMLEGLIPLYSFSYKKLKHAGVNIILTAVNAAIGLSLAFALLKVTEFTAANSFGILYLIDLPLWLEVIVGVMLLDLVGAYFVHWTEHKVKWMWKFHLVHHSDRNVDVTTGLRHHPGEIIFRLSFTLLAAFVSGADIAVVFLYQSLSVLFTHLTHANINMATAVDRALSWIFVTPNMHKVHHHFQQPLTDTNYGNIFALWDRLFGTFAYAEKGSIVYGVDTHMKPEENESIGNLFKIPFQKYRQPEDVDSSTDS